MSLTTPLLRFLTVTMLLPLGEVAIAASLNQAVVTGDEASIRQLLSRGADLTERDAAGLTPLINAALAGRPNVVRLLVSSGASPAARDSKGLTALHAAAHMGQADIVSFLLAQKVDMNDQANSFGLTPLHAAAEANHLEVARLLLDAGAQTELPDSSGWVPIMRATFREHPGMIRLLREHGAKCRTRSDLLGFVPPGLEPFMSYCQSAGN